MITVTEFCRLVRLELELFEDGKKKGSPHGYSLIKKTSLEWLQEFSVWRRFKTS